MSHTATATAPIDWLRDLKTIRRNRGMTGAQLAAELGMHPNTLYRIESGKGQPNAANKRRIADFLGYTVVECWPLPEDDS